MHEMDSSPGATNIFSLKDLKISPNPVYQYTKAQKGQAIIIDNGSFNCRVGWANDLKPKFVFRNCYARQRKDRTKKGNNVPETEILVANDISNLEANRFQLKFPHDENVVTHFEGQEIMLDYIFTHLGIDTGKVNHPIIMTETFCNPNFSRQCMSELLFDCYRAPKLNYCVDGLLSYCLHCPLEDGIIINIGNWTTHIIPVINGRPGYGKCKRIKVGGQHLIRYLWRWLQLKFPRHVNAITISRAEEILFDHMYIVADYQREIRKWTDSSYYNENLKKIQLPFTAQVVTAVSPEQLKERKKEAAKRLVEINAKKREEKLEEELSELNRLIEVQEAIGEISSEDEVRDTLLEANVSSREVLQKKINVVEQKIDKIRNKISQVASGIEDVIDEPKPKRLCLPINETEKDTWLSNVKQQWLDIQSRKSSRRQKRQEMAKRRTVASQERMRIISQLAKRETKDDNFGMNDDDWDVYKTINRDGGGSDSEEDDEKLQDLEAVLRHHLPEFLGENSTSRHIQQAEDYQLIIANEQIRIGELLFQPSMNGIEQGGISDTLQYVLSFYDEETQGVLANNVFVTGGTSKIRGIKERLEKDLLEMRPFKSKFKVIIDKEPDTSPWQGAAKMVKELLSTAITKSEYEQCKDKVKLHKAGNQYWKGEVVKSDKENEESVTKK